MGLVPLLLNTLIILISVLCYQVFWLDREDTEPKNELIISLLASVAIVLCMTFPFRTHFGFIYDLRTVPIILCFLFGGVRSTLFVGVVYLSYRYYLGGAGFYTAVIIFGFLCLVVSCFYVFAPAFFRKRKMFIGIILLSVYTAIFYIAATLHVQNSVLRFDLHMTLLQLLHFSINLLTMGIAFYLIDGMLEKKRLKEKFRRAENLFILGELSAAFVHEIGNPLTAVHGFLQFMMNHPLTDKKRNEYLYLMKTELLHAESILAQYLSLKSQADTKETIDVGSLILEAIKTLSPAATENFVQIQDKLQLGVMIEANPLKLKQCLIHMMKTGIEAMTAGGVLTITLKQERNEAAIDIVDTGAGMTKEEIKRKGMPFYSTKEEGTGLETMVAFSMIKELKGDVEIKSKKGEGTCCSITIPVALNRRTETAFIREA